MKKKIAFTLMIFFILIVNVKGLENEEEVKLIDEENLTTEIKNENLNDDKEGLIENGDLNDDKESLIEKDIQDEIENTNNIVEENTINNDSNSSNSEKREINKYEVYEKENNNQNLLTKTTNDQSVEYQVHVSSIGWQDITSNGETAGTTGQSKSIEAIKIEIENQQYSGSVEYKTYIENIGWEEEYKQNGEISGTTGEAKKVEAIQIKLTGEIANYYDIYYRVHAQAFGWLGWAKNGESAGTVGYDLRLEAIKIALKLKEENIENEGQAYYGKIINYETHVETYGWQDTKFDGEMSGTTGEGKRIEAIKIELINQEYSGNVEYKTHIQDIGWQKYKQNGEISGTTGQSKRIEAIQINLSGEIANYYDIYYRVHAQAFGWLDWAKNGESAGTTGYGLRLEAIEIMLKHKDEVIKTTGETFITRKIAYASHIEEIGWQDIKYDGDSSGTTGEGKRIEAIKIELINQEYSGNIEYKTHIQDIGWQEYKQNGEISGTTGQSKRIEAIQINLSGEIANYYDIYYRVHAQAFGWLGWTKNGESAGTTGYGLRLEAIEIILKKKNEEILTNEDAYIARKVAYASHIEGTGWQDIKYDGDSSGTTGEGKRLESFNIILIEQEYNGNVEYKSYIEDTGWEQMYKINGENSGTTGEGKRIEAIRIKLTGEIAEIYDIYYSVHVQGFGNLGWAKNDEITGTFGYAYRIEALQIMLLKKGETIENTNSIYIENTDGYFIIASSLDTAKVLDAYGELTKDGTNITLHQRIDSLAQIWKITKNKDETYTITTSLNPNVNMSANNNNVELLSNRASNEQKWIIRNTNDGYVYIISKGNGLYINVKDGETDNTTNVQLSTGNETNAQKYLLIAYNKQKIYKGMDISDHQTVDWNIAQYDVNFAIIRLGFGSDYTSQDDTQFINNIRSCEENNIPYGIYIYSYALNTEDALSEAEHALRLLQETGANFQLGIWFDMEDADNYKLRHGFFEGDYKNKEVEICEIFLRTISNNGYKTGLYASLSWLNNELNDPRIDGYDKWVAHWNGPVTFEDAKNHSTSYQGKYSLWQFCSDGHVSGVTGGTWNNVDLDLGYDIF